MYNNVIFIDKSYWLWTLLSLSILIGIPITWKMRPADTLASSIGVVFLAAIIMFGGLCILKFFGLEFGMSG